MNRRTVRYRCIKQDDPALRRRIKEISWHRVRYGYKRITVLLRREGWAVGVKRVRRI
jgi:putative transposase